MAKLRQQSVESPDQEGERVTDSGTFGGDMWTSGGLDASVRRWRAAGIIDEGQAQRIVALEQAEQVRRGRDEAARPGPLEAFVYLGLAVASVGVIALTAQHWDELNSSSRVGVWAVPGLLAVVLGGVLRRAVQPQLGRAAGMAWLAGVVLLFGAAITVGTEAAWEVPDVFLVASVTATILATGLWAQHRATPQVIALAGSLAWLAQAIAQQRAYNVEDGGGDPLTFGMLLMVFGAVWIVLAELGLLTPRVPSRALGAAGLVAGPFWAGYPGTPYTPLVWAQVLMFIAAGLLVFLSLRRASFTYMLAGIAGAFIGLVAFIFEHFEEEIGAPVALILSGALLVAATQLLAAFRARLHGPGNSGQQA